jgi:hypothetical protein
MRCSDFLIRYSDFRDETVADPTLRRRLVEHVSRCRRCARYDETIERGVRLLRAAKGVEASPGFRARLSRKLAAALRHSEPLYAVPVRVFGAVVVAAALAVLIVEGLTRDDRDLETVTPPGQPMPMVQMNPGPPFVTFGNLAGPVTLRPAPTYTSESTRDSAPSFLFADAPGPQ